MRSSKIAAISLGLMAVISCSSAGINNTNNNDNNEVDQKRERRIMG